MKKSQLKEAIKNEIKSILSENQMTTDEAFRILRGIESVLPKRPSPSHIQLMGQALDHLQAGEITKMMDRERGLSETRLNQNVGLAHIKSSGENDGGRAMMNHLKHNDFKNAPDMEAYTDGFVKGASNSADYLKSKLGQAIRGGGDEESLMGLVGLNEISSTEANAQLMEIVEHQKQILNILKELKKGDAVFAIKGADLNAAIKLITNEVGKTLTKVKNLEQIKGLQTTFADIREDRNKQLVGLELVQFLMDRFNMSEDEALKSLADNIGNVKHEEKDKIRESEEMTDTEMNAKAEKEAKEADKKAKKEEKELKLKVDKIKSILKKNKTDISRIAKLPRNKRTKADDEMFDSMVSKTKELKKLEKDLK